MSYILDALRKSEQERRQTDPLIMSAPAAEVIQLPHRPMTPWAVAGGAMALLAMAGALWLYARTPASKVDVASAPALSVSSTTVNLMPSSSAVAPSSRAENPLPELKAHPLVPPADNAGARDLALEAQLDRPKLTPRSTPAPETQPQTSASSNIAPAARADDAVKFLRAMPSEFQRSLPELIVNIHIYAPREADRILYINNRQYHAGDRVRSDVVVEEIVEDGAVLSSRGQRFKLPRPS